jgi:hypothetical protein
MTTGKSIDASSPAEPAPDASRPSATFRPAMVVTPTFAVPPVATASAAPPPETAAELLARLRRLHADGRVAIDIDVKRLMHMDSPVGFEAESNQWVYGLLALTAALWYVFGYKTGLATAAVSLSLYLSLGKIYLRRRIARRVRGRALDDEEQWRRLWDFGGVTLLETGPDGDGVRCGAPADNWMEFTRRFSRG